MDNVYCIVSLTGRISQPTQKKTLREPLVYNNMMAHCLRFHALNDNGSPADLTGVGVTGDFTVSGHDSILPILGTVSGNTAELILPAPCYAYAGRYTAHMNLTKNGQTRTVMTVDGFVERNTTDAIVDPGTPVSNIETAINGANAAAAAANASVAQANAALDTATQAAARANAGADNLESTRQSLLDAVDQKGDEIEDSLDDKISEVKTKHLEDIEQLKANISIAGAALENAGILRFEMDEKGHLLVIRTPNLPYRFAIENGRLACYVRN